MSRRVEMEGIVTVRLVRHPALSDDDMARLFDNAAQSLNVLFPVLGAVLVDFSLGPGALGTGLDVALGQFFARLETLGIPFAFVGSATPLGKLHGGRLVADFAPRTGSAFTEEAEARRVLTLRAKPAGTFTPRAGQGWDPPAPSDSNRGALGFGDPNRGKTNPNPFGDPNRGKTNPNPFGDPNRGKTNPNPFGDPNRGKTNPNPFGDSNRGKTNPNPFGDPNRKSNPELSLPLLRPSDPKFKL